jgi:josephin
VKYLWIRRGANGSRAQVGWYASGTRSFQTMEDLQRTLYHEKQRLALCGLHAVNNLLQGPFYTKRDFDDVCEVLDRAVFFNRHRSLLGIGNFDINVLSLLLERAQLTVRRHDRRRALAEFDLEENGLVGILQNVASPRSLSQLFYFFFSSSRHWRTFLNMNGLWWNLDSNLPAPQVIGSHLDCVNLLNGDVNDDSHILLVLRTTTSEGEPFR